MPDSTPTAEEISLLQKVAAGEHKFENADAASAFLDTIANLAIRGLFAGGGAYFRLECPSWLDQRLATALDAAEHLTGTTIDNWMFSRVQTDQQWTAIVDSYLMFPRRISSYKNATATPPSTPVGYRNAWVTQHEKWRAKAFTPPRNRKRT